jgi:hypothetical protein
VDPVIPLPVVRTAVRCSWNQIYRDADRGHLGPITRIGSRLYVRRSLAQEYVREADPQSGPLELERLLQPQDVHEVRP